MKDENKDERPVKEIDLNKDTECYLQPLCPHCREPIVFDKKNLRHLLFCKKCHQKLIL